MIVWLLAMGASAGALLCGGVTLVVWQSLHPARLSLRSTPADDGIAYEDVSFPSRDGFTLSGWWIPASSPKGTVILCHGYPSKRHDMLPMIPFLNRAGYNLLAFDFRRLGKSGGDVSTIGLREPRDLAGAVDYALQRSDKPVAVFG